MPNEYDTAELAAEHDFLTGAEIVSTATGEALEGIANYYHELEVAEAEYDELSEAA